MSNDRAGYSLPGIDCKFLIFFEESLFLAVNYVYPMLKPRRRSYVKFANFLYFSKFGMLAVTSLLVPRRWNQCPTIGQGIPFQESIANFLYFSRKAYFWRLIMFILKSRRLLC